MATIMSDYSRSLQKIADGLDEAHEIYMLEKDAQAARIAALEAALQELILEWDKSDDMKLRARHIEKARAVLYPAP